jgi:hypothetical protein
LPICLHHGFQFLPISTESSDFLYKISNLCGVRQIWENIVKRAGLADSVPVIGGGRVADGLVVTPAVKERLVSLLQDQHNITVWAFGDSPPDLPTLSRADKGGRGRRRRIHAQRYYGCPTIRIGASGSLGLSAGHHSPKAEHG